VLLNVVEYEPTLAVRARTVILWLVPEARVATLVHELVDLSGDVLG
jgi:hypothetical protein